MEPKETFERTVLKIALPVTAQSLLQSSFSVIDQVMIGQLGSGSIAGVGLAGKFASLYSVILAAVASAAGIMISQYMGKKDERRIAGSFSMALAFAAGLAAVFTLLCVLFPEHIMSVYTGDAATLALAAAYLRIFALSFLPAAVNAVVTTMLRCMEAALLPLYASIFALILNTGLNYLLIFGKWVFPEMGVRGAAAASAVSQTIACALVAVFFFAVIRRRERERDTCGRSVRGTVQKESAHGTVQKERARRTMQEESRQPLPLQREFGLQYLKILGPLLLCEFLWSLGENVYTAIYGNIGTDACAAMTMTIPVQTVVIGALGGLAQASGILVGKSLGKGAYERAYAESKKLLLYGFFGSLLLSLALAAVGPYYVKIYEVEPAVQELTVRLLAVIAVIAPVKVQNMILGGGIIRSGGKTKYAMWIDLIGTWGFGVPLGLFSAFVLRLPITYVYFILSLEECVRLGISLVVFRKKRWMDSI